MSTVLETPAAENLKRTFPIRTFEAEPSWLTARREAGREQFESLPMPSPRDERWRFASTGKLTIDGYAFANAPADGIARRLIQRSNLVSQRAGRLVFADDHQIDFEPVSDALKAKGVIYLPIMDAVREHPELLKRLFLKESTELGSEKFFGLHAASVQAGSVLFVPKNVEIEDPLVNFHWLSESRAAVFPHTLVVLEDNAKASVVDVFFSEGDGNEGFCSAVCNIQAGPGAEVFRKVVQDWNEQTTSFQMDTTVADRDAGVKSVAVNIGAERARYESQTRIEGPGAHVKMYSLSIAETHQEFDQRTFQIHNAPNAVSDLLYKNALLDNSRTIFSGLIKVAEGAQQTDAYQTNRNLLLDPTAEANALPGLEILANDVKCSHGATTGNVSSDELFYMMARGIPKRTAMSLMVYGFFDEIIEKVESDELADNLRAILRRKFESKIGSV